MHMQEMAEQPTWPSRAIIFGPTTLTTWLQQQSTSSSMPLTEMKGGIGIFKDIAYYTRNNKPFLNDSGKMDMQKWMKEVKQGIIKQGSRRQQLIVSRQIMCNAELRQDFAKCVVLFKDYIM